ncbi:MAG: histidine kinase [Leucobacter sp.]
MHNSSVSPAPGSAARPPAEPDDSGSLSVDSGSQSAAIGSLARGRFGIAAPHRTPLARALNLLGAAVVLGYLWSAAARGAVALPAVAVPLGVLAVAAWTAAVLVPLRLRRALRALLLVMAAAGAFAAWSTDGLLIVPVIAGVMQIAAWDEASWVGVAAAVMSGGLIAVGALVAAAAEGESGSFPGMLALEAGVLVAFLGGSNRRQAHAREAATRAAAEQAAAAREERTRAGALAMRQGLARDMHDVLAHSLGGLVIQLDAAEAQLEAGRVPDALVRLRDARELAASGLAEARRTVETLRADPEPRDAGPVSGAELTAAIGELVDAHGRIGGAVEFELSGEPRELARDAATALRRAAQEALSNARKHAPGEPVRVELAWADERVELTVQNRVPAAGSLDAAPLSASGAGRGLAGMRERFAELPGGEAEVGERDGVFEVRVSAPISTHTAVRLSAAPVSAPLPTRISARREEER